MISTPTRVYMSYIDIIIYVCMYIYIVSNQQILLYIYISICWLLHYIYIYIFIYDIQLAQKDLLKLRDGRRKGADQPPKSALKPWLVPMAEFQWGHGQRKCHGEMNHTLW
jgi:hypothetical protein